MQPRHPRWGIGALVAGLAALGSITMGAGPAGASAPPSAPAPPPSTPAGPGVDSGLAVERPCPPSTGQPIDTSAGADASATGSVADTVVTDPPGSEAGSSALAIPLPSDTTAGPVDTGVPLAGSLPIDQVVVLARDGIGLVSFCTDADAAIAAVTAVLGSPDDDTGWADPLSISACSGTEVRRVTWGSLDLYFGDVSRFAEGRPHFFGYSYGDVDGFEVAPPGLATPEGIGLGTSVAFLRAAYPAVSLIPGEESIQEPTFYVDDSLRGLVTDVADDGVVTVVIGGEACGF